MLPTLMVIVDTSVVNVSLDHIRGSLSAGIDEATWSITAYLAANAIVIPMTGWLSGVFGRKKYLIFSIALFTVSSLLCGTAWSIQSLIFFRILQGLAGGASQPLSQSILLETFPPSQHGTAMAAYGIGIMLGPIIGPVLGGWITDNWSWEWIFFINVPIGILSIIMAILFLFDPPYIYRGKMKIDYGGLAFLTIGIGCLQVMLDQGQREDWFASDFIVWMTALSAIGLIMFIITELRSEHPIVDLKVFKGITFTSGNIILFLVMTNIFGVVILVPICLQSLLGYTAALAGIALAPGGVFYVLTIPFIGRLVNRISPKILLIIGILISAYSTYMMVFFNISVDFSTILWPRVIMGVGNAFIFIPLTLMTLREIRKEEMGNASAIFNLVRNVGASFGVAFASTMFARHAQIHQARLVEYLSPLSLNYSWNFPDATSFLRDKGFDPISAGRAGEAVIYAGLLKQANMMSFNDVFYILTILLIITVPMVFLLKVNKNPATDL